MLSRPFPWPTSPFLLFGLLWVHLSLQPRGGVLPPEQAGSFRADIEFFATMVRDPHFEDPSLASVMRRATIANLWPFESSFVFFFGGSIAAFKVTIVGFFVEKKLNEEAHLFWLCVLGFSAITTTDFYMQCAHGFVRLDK